MAETINNYYPIEKKKKLLPLIYCLITVVIVVIGGSMAYVLHTGTQMTEVHTPLIDAAMEIKLEVTTGHLWFEEIMHGDKHETLDSVLEELDGAAWYATAMLEGGQNPEGTFLPLKDTKVRNEISEVRDRLTEFRAVTLERWDARETSGIGSKIDQKYDAMFMELMVLADNIETDIQRMIAKELKIFRATQITLIVFCVFVILTAGIAISRLIHQQIEDQIALDATNQLLDATNQQLTANEQQLRAANQQLTASEQQLRASNQQLTASEQQLMAANQQLTANEQQLRAANQQLTASEQQLRSSNEEIEFANKAKSQFLANMSHEIRTPMNLIMGFTGVLDNDELNDDQKNSVGYIKQASRSLLRVINDILDVSRIEAGKMDIRMEECSLGDLLASVKSMMLPLVQAKDLRFEIIKSDQLPAMIRTDRDRLYQCLVNVVGNAIKFTEKGHVHLNVDVKDTCGKPMLCFEVEDTGIGIPQDKRDTIFETFSQADNSHTRKYDGTGLGLTITKQLVELLEGTISFTSEENKGSVFSIMIPAGTDMELEMVIEDDSQDAGFAVSDETQGVCGLSGKVLLAEDNEGCQALTKKQLASFGVEVAIVGNGNEAVKIVEEQSFDVILMDMQMPYLNGYQATEMLVAKGVTTPIVALTAYAMAGDKEKCIEAGCVDYLSKPFTKKELGAVLRKHMSLDADPV
jgi:signal transduction histidine kinase